MATFRIGKVVLKSLFKKPATLMYPVVPREWQERTRGQVGIHEQDCIACGICAQKCPANAITVDRNKRTWTIQRMQCIQCNCCVEVCPKSCLVMENQYPEPGGEKLVHTFQIPKKEKAAAKADEKKEDDAVETAEYSCPANEKGLRCKISDCIYCGLCAKACPAECLTVDRKEKVWKVDKDACVTCEACVNQCPKDCLEVL